MTAAAPGPLSFVVVVAQYPPHHRGGYELRCRDVCRELVRRGHRVTVLTSRVGARGVEDDGGVRVVRALHLWPEGVTGWGGVAGFALASASDCRRLRIELRRTGAAAVAYWHQSGLSSALLAVRPPSGCGILCDVSSDWLLDSAGTGGNWFRIWERPSPTWWKAAGKAAIRTFAAIAGAPARRPQFPPGHAYFTSADMKRRYVEAGVPVADATVIRSGIDLEKFTFRQERDHLERRKLLFLGRIKRRKGLHTVVLSLGYLPADVRLEVIGAIEDPGYVAEVAELVRATKVGARVRIAAPVEHAAVAEQMRAAGVLVFASEEPEAFSRLVLEAFACGTPVVGTTLGGTGEVLREGDTGLTFQPGNARQLADQLARVLGDDALRTRLVANARTLVETRYALGFTVGQIESLLRDVHAKASPPPETQPASAPASGTAGGSSRRPG